MTRFFPLPSREPADCPSPKRSPRRNALVDTAAVVAAALFGTLTYFDATFEMDPSTLGNVLIITAGILACLTLFFRRRWPVQIGIATMLVAIFSPAASGAALVAIFTVAIHRQWKIAAAIAAVSIATYPIYYSMYTSENALWVDMVTVTVFISGIVAWGMWVRARRQLFESLRERAVQAEADRDLRLAQAREQERTRIAREMHDVLAHRISLVALNAGALEFRPDASPEEVRQAAAIVRSNAHQALDELRDVISVLREEDQGQLGANEPPQPTLIDVEALIQESRESGVEVEFAEEVEGISLVPDSTGRTAYRVIQEGLTNARKHAPGGAAQVAVAGAPGDGLTVEVSNRRPLIEPESPIDIPGSGTGLIGLTERVELAGGRLRHGPQADGRFTLQVWLPWTD
ncbi:MAG TPA: histidine kinase [Solirubrobacterales bacterium]|nr:histidine kinase [Solirubrobacterales bacterium]